MRRRSAWAPIVLACLAWASTSTGNAAQTSNGLRNPGFEAADGYLPAYWQRRTPPDAIRSLTWTDETSHTGSHCVTIANREETLSRWRTGHLASIWVTPGSRCQLSAWVRTQSVAGNGAGLRLYIMSPKGAILLQPRSELVRGDSDWSQLTVSAVVPAGPAAYAMAYLELEGTGTAWFDDAHLTGTPAPRPSDAAPPAVTCTLGPEEAVELTGFHQASVDRRQGLALDADTEQGSIEFVFPAEAAEYTLTLEAIVPTAGCHLQLFVNGAPVAEAQLSTTASQHNARKRPVSTNFAGLRLQRNSRLRLTVRRPQEGSCVVFPLKFSSTGAFEGELAAPADLGVSPRLLACPDPAERAERGRRLARLVHEQALPQASARREAELEGLKTPADWQRRLDETRARLADFWGPFPPRTPLNPRLLGTIRRDGFAIEKIVYESRPGYFVTANLYLPSTGAAPYPAALFVCGHAAEGKAAKLYHECCLGLVLKGYVVLAIDPMGQGERSEYFDAAGERHLVALTVAQHHQLGRPSFLVAQTLGGYRTWDAIRGVDYLTQRPEVDSTRIAAVGNSGGGQMAFLVTAADERVAVCVAAHPGGPMENTYLNGQSLADRDVLSLIAPRPCRVVIGRDAREEYHVQKVEQMRRFYRGLGVDENRCEVAWVEGVHDMRRPKREATYEWLNRWFGKEDAGAAEPELEPLTPDELQCTSSGFTLRSLGGESGHSLNLQRYHATRPRRAPPDTEQAAATQAAALRKTAAERFGLAPDAPAAPLAVDERQTRQAGDATARLLVLHALPDVSIPALLLEPGRTREDLPLVVHVADAGKPQRLDQESLPLALCRQGFRVLSLDVCGTGEADPVRAPLPVVRQGYQASHWGRDGLAICLHAHAGRTIAALQAEDLCRGASWLLAQGEPPARAEQVALVAEGETAVAAFLAAAVLGQRVAHVVSVRSIPSYALILEEPFPAVRDLFWVPGVTAHLDLAELSLLTDGGATWATPVDGAGKPLSHERAASIFEWTRQTAGKLGRTVAVVAVDDEAPDALARAVAQALTPRE